MKIGDTIHGNMEVLGVRFTRRDHATVPGGIVLVKNPNKYGDGKHEYIAWNFERTPGTLAPKGFFWGRYCRTALDGQNAYNDKVNRAERYTTGGSLIESYQLESELAKERADGEVHA